MARICLVFPKKRGTISPYIYGVLAEHIGGVIYDGIYCGRDSGTENIDGFRSFIVEKIRQAKIPMIRWPGGCFAEVYDWKDGIGDVSQRPQKRSWWTTLDGKAEDNRVGTDEFLHFCELCGAEPYIALNLASSTPSDARDWIDYCNAPTGSTYFAKLREENGRSEPYGVKYWGIGNECWGDGGNMTAEEYAHEYRKYASVLSGSGKDLKLIACGAPDFHWEWTREFLTALEKPIFRLRHIDGLSFHYYTPNRDGDEVVSHEDEDWYRILREGLKMQELIDRHYAAAVSFGLENNARLCIDEWGVWHREGTGQSRGEKLFEQQSTMRDAVHAALTLNIFNNSCEKILLANIAQLVNCIQSLFLAEGDKCIVTPVYHVFDMFKAHRNSTLVETVTECGNAAEGVPEISASASLKDGKLTLTVANLCSSKDVDVTLETLGARFCGKAQVKVLRGDSYTAHNTFDDPLRVKPEAFGIDGFDGKVTVPRASVVSIVCSVE